MLMYQKKTCWSLFILHKTFFSLENLEKLLQKVLFTCPYNDTVKHVNCERFENAAPRAKTYVIATVHFTDDDVSFYDSPGMLIRKTTKPRINSAWIAFLIHGFVLVKTWLLIAYDTAFYSMIDITVTSRNKSLWMRTLYWFGVRLCVLKRAKRSISMQFTKPYTKHWHKRTLCLPSGQLSVRFLTGNQSHHTVG